MSAEDRARDPSASAYRSYLYVAGYDSRRVRKALSSEADAIVLDLEDAVPVDRKDEARDTVAAVLSSEPEKPIFVRVNPLISGMLEEDLAAVDSQYLSGIRVPKTESADEARAVAERLGASGAVLQCLLESALGIEHAYDIASAHPSVSGLSLGEADLRADLGVKTDAGLGYARSRVVVASRAAGLAPPVQSVYTNVRDLSGLKESTQSGRDQGFLGRSAVHPDQIPIINAVFTPTRAEVLEAENIIERLRESSEAGAGAFLLEDGRFVDPAVVESARSTLALSPRKEGGA